MMCEELHQGGCDFDLMEADARRKAARVVEYMDDMTHEEAQALYLVVLEYWREVREGGHSLVVLDAMRRLSGVAAARLERFERVFADDLAE